MAVTPNTVLYLLKSPIELDNLNQLTFSNKQAQENYFLSLPRIEATQISYQRKDNTIRFPAHIDSILEYNYCMYQNSNYSNKWFYAYITNMEYANDGMTIITIDTDVYQTWQFDIDIKRSFVVREHTNNDTVGNNTVPEGLEKGTMIMTNCTPITYFRDTVDSGADIPTKSVIVVGTTLDLSTSAFNESFGESYQSLYSGVSYFAFPADNVSYLNNCLKAINDSSTTNIEDIVSIFMAPKDMVLGLNGAIDIEYTVAGGQVKCHKITDLDLDYFRTITYTVNKPTSIDGYTPTNKKLLTGEFNMMNVTNFQGVNQMYRYEYFNGNNCQFHMRGALKPECSIYMYPLNYLHAATDPSYTDSAYSIVAPPIPVCNWNSDQYIAWLASTSHQRAANIATGVGSAILGAGLIAGGVVASLGTAGMATPIGGGLITAGTATMAGAGLTGSGIKSILNTASTMEDHEKDANANNGSLASADSNYVNSKVFGAYQYCIRSEYAQKIDRILSATGYATNTMKIPNVTGRRNWNYVQTQAVAILGAIPQEDLQRIKNMFNNGVTFWHNPATFLDYSQNNDII